jgi:LPS sulfotransferase NodH
MQSRTYDAETNDPGRIARRRRLRDLIDLAPTRVMATGGAKRFVVFGLGRSGSTLLVDLLNADPAIRCDGEIFQHWRYFPERILRRKIRLLEADAYGFKLLAYQVTKVLGYREPRRFLDWLQASGFRFVTIRRENLFRHALSQVAARKSRFHLEGPTSERIKVSVDPAEIEAWMDRIRRNREEEQTMLAGREALHLVYEQDLIGEERQRQAVARIGAFIGRDIVFANSRFRRIVSDDLSDSFENADELRRYMTERGFA